VFLARTGKLAQHLLYTQWIASVCVTPQQSIIRTVSTFTEIEKELRHNSFQVSPPVWQQFVQGRTLEQQGLLKRQSRKEHSTTQSNRSLGQRKSLPQDSGAARRIGGLQRLEKGVLIDSHAILQYMLLSTLFDRISHEQECYE